jgi:hypothetical protein
MKFCCVLSSVNHINNQTNLKYVLHMERIALCTRKVPPSSNRKTASHSWPFSLKSFKISISCVLKHLSSLWYSDCCDLQVHGLASIFWKKRTITITISSYWHASHSQFRDNIKMKLKGIGYVDWLYLPHDMNQTRGLVYKVMEILFQ